MGAPVLLLVLHVSQNRRPPTGNTDVDTNRCGKTSCIDARTEKNILWKCFSSYEMYVFYFYFYTFFFCFFLKKRKTEKKYRSRIKTENKVQNLRKKSIELEECAFQNSKRTEKMQRSRNRRTYISELLF